jgi:hypothetical protein
VDVELHAGRGQRDERVDDAGRESILPVRKTGSQKEDSKRRRRISA